MGERVLRGGTQRSEHELAQSERAKGSPLTYRCSRNSPLAVKSVNSILVVLLIAALASAEGIAQTQSGTIPRTPDGRPDLSGVWQVLNSAAYDIEDHHAQPGVPAGTGVVVGGEIPYQPWALEQKKRNYANRLTE